MQLTIFGATGGTGKQLVEQALAAGNQVVAFVRNPSKLTTRHDRLTIVQGELADSAAIECAISGADAVISVLGPRGDSSGKPITRGTQNILAAMEKCRVRRFVLSSTPSASDPNDSPDFRFKIAVGLIRLMVRSAYEDIVNTAQIVRASDCDWTIVRVSMLTDAPKTGRVKVGYVNKAMGMHLARADMAEFMLKQVQDTKYLRQAPAISN
jgi:NAD(P)-dependent dehydrogenase (short-subunit alcohol dehydrogenase family)